MANPEHIDFLSQGIVVWNAWREANPSIRPDLSEANLSGLNLREINLVGADLHEVNFSDTDLGTSLYVQRQFGESESSRGLLTACAFDRIVSPSSVFEWCGCLSWIVGHGRHARSRLM